MGAILASVEDVQQGFERPIPSHLQPKVTEFLARASRRLHMMIGPKLQRALDDLAGESGYNPEEPTSETNVPPTVWGFARDMVVQAAENKLRNFGGFSSESAGVFSVTREDFWALGRTTFAPEDIALLEEAIDEDFEAQAVGPIRTGIPCHRLPWGP